MMDGVIHDRAVIYALKPGGHLDRVIDPGSGIVGVGGASGQVQLYFEGNRYQASNLRTPEERVVSAFGRAATHYPTIATLAVVGADIFDLIRVGEINWPNRIQFDSVDSARIFAAYTGRSQPLVEPERQAVSSPGLLEVDVRACIGAYDEPTERLEWQWIEAHASFQHVGNGEQPGVWEFVLRVPTGEDGDEFDSLPPERLQRIVDYARAQGYGYMMFHQG